jgi:transcriptional regulator with XRE-family HTH domain
MIGSRRRSTEELMADVGRQIRDARIEAGFDQRTLAERADVSVPTLSKLENGHGSNLATFVRVVRALDRTDWLDGLAPATSVSPIRIADSGGRARRRVRVSRASAAMRAGR